MKKALRPLRSLAAANASAVYAAPGCEQTLFLACSATKSAFLPVFLFNPNLSEQLDHPQKSLRQINKTDCRFAVKYTT